jgi:selenocysteine lyase/cysteine desulfurase
VKPVTLQLNRQGVITWDVIERALTARTRLVSLASCHFLSGYRIDIDGIGKGLHERGILFCVDGIQTLGAFPIRVEHVDFLSADSHKWLLGPSGAGIVYVKRQHQEMLRPSLLGAWNVVSPGFVAQETMRYETGGRRYEPGALNLPGIAGMAASMQMLMDLGIDSIGKRLLGLRTVLLERLCESGFRPFSDWADYSDGPQCGGSAIVTVTREGTDLKALYKRLEGENIVVSLRQDRAGTGYLRFSPHFYNTVDEIDRVVQVVAYATGKSESGHPPL